MAIFAKKYWWWFFACLLADVVCLFIGNADCHFWLKITLMPWLVVALIAGKKETRERHWHIILAGLLLAWAGDVLLLFSADQPLFFMLGLGCFLLTHLCYIRYFSKYHKGKLYWLIRRPASPLALAVYAAVLTGYLLPRLAMLKIPVVVYVLVIALMVLQALACRPFLSARVYGWFVAGALLFCISDSILAIDKFVQPSTWANALLMATYGLAQACFVKGALANTDGRLANGHL
jgi:uncharacterized membrane protein YhhN